MTNFAFCDGSVRAINNKLDEELFRQLGTIDGGEIVIWAND
jgi:prepilin-type processing-associated H-X9-DG protein